jgi:hypothetical protein
MKKVYLLEPNDIVQENDLAWSQYTESWYNIDVWSYDIQPGDRAGGCSTAIIREIEETTNE